MFKFLNSIFVRSFEIILVVAGVLVFTFFDPFNIFAARLTLKDTPVSERSIREIGELITAEYYGEVIASLPETLREEVAQEASVLQEELLEYHEDFKDAVLELRELEDIKRGKSITDRFESDNQELVNDALYDEYIYFLRYHYNTRQDIFPSSEFGKTMNRRQRRRFFKELKQDTVKYNLDSLNVDAYITAFQEETNDQVRREFRKSRLVILGRGWVKAGFKFGSFTENNFRYDANQRIVHFIGMQPEIISATINPWFIPERGVEGFEIMIADGPAKRSHELMQRVKQLCLDKLRQQAMDRDILGRARKNAEDNMQAFFSLLIDGEEISRVYFHANVLDYTVTSLLEDGVLRDAEFMVLDSTLIRAQIHQGGLRPTNRYEQSIAFLDTLRKTPKVMFDTTYTSPLNRYTHLLYQVGEDNILSLGEQEMLDELTYSIASLDSLDRFWYEIEAPDDTTLTLDSLAFLTQKKIDFQTIVLDELLERTRIIEQDSIDIQPDTLTIATGDSLIYRYVIENRNEAEIRAWFVRLNTRLNTRTSRIPTSSVSNGSGADTPSEDSTEPPPFDPNVLQPIQPAPLETESPSTSTTSSNGSG